MTTEHEHLMKLIDNIPVAQLREFADEKEKREARNDEAMKRWSEEARWRAAAKDKEIEEAKRVGRINQAVRLLRQHQWSPPFSGTSEPLSNAQKRDRHLRAKLDETKRLLDLARLHGKDTYNAQREHDAYERQLAENQRHAESLQPSPARPWREHYELFVRNHPPTILDEFVAKLLDTPIDELPEGARVVSADVKAGVVKTLDGREFAVLPTRKERSHVTWLNG